MLRCIDNQYSKCIIITAHKPKSTFLPNHNPTQTHPQNNSKKSFQNPTSNVPLTVSQILCRSIAVFSFAKKLFANFHHIIKRASSAILKPKMLLMFIDYLLCFWVLAPQFFNTDKLPCVYFLLFQCLFLQCIFCLLLLSEILP